MTELETMDFLDDLFSDIPYNNSVSPSTASLSSLDSGHGSPESYSSNSPEMADDSNSPGSFQWESTNSDMWGSILDDLPAELSDDSEGGNNFVNEPLTWKDEKTDLITDASVIQSDMSMLEKTAADVKNEVEEDDYLKIKNEPMVSMEMLFNSTNSTIKTQAKNVITVKNTQNKLAISNPLVLKPISLVNGSTNTSNIQSHIKIGNNVFAIIQKSNPTSTLSVTTKPQSLTQAKNGIKTETNTL